MLDSIPNNVRLEDDPKLQRALLRWQPDFLNWWREMGPEGFQEDRVFLRTAVGLGSGDWAVYDYVKMPDYRWGVFLANPRKKDTIYFGDHIGEKLWEQVPGEHRKELRRLIVTQGDTEPASVEQQRLLGRIAPSLLDLRNLFQVNVEEARHLWAMVYLLHSYFGKDGRDEADELLVRRSGHQDHPRILQAFNKPQNDWLAFFCFTMFTDRDGKFQLASLAESAFDPLARSTEFMLMEEAFHLSVGETGVGRVVRRTAEVMQAGQDPRQVGAIPLEIIQKYFNEWASACFDLFGGEDSSNAATYFSAGLKGRFNEIDDKKYGDHRALDQAYTTELYEGDHWTRKEIPLRRAMNAVLLDEYVDDCRRALKRWNGILEEHGLSERLTLPSTRFNRSVGLYAERRFDPDGNPVSEEAYHAGLQRWMPSQDDYDYVRQCMVPVLEPGKVAGWVAPPTRGFGGKGLDFEYVLFH
jgi:benzoyl-CoA 2,3-dioxygenase component B